MQPEADDGHRVRHKLWLFGAILIGLAIILFAVTIVVSIVLGFSHHGWGMMGGHAFLFMALAPVIVLFLLVFFIAILVSPLSRGYRRRSHPPYPDLSPREILDRRYASGEVSREQYITIKEDLIGAADGNSPH